MSKPTYGGTVYDDVDNASTRPSAPRGAPAQAHATGPALTTTLPVVQWHASGAVLQPSSLPRYETLALLGEGGMGAVVRVRDNDIGREVALKRLRSDLQHPELYARFIEEVRTVGQLEHPNIVPIHDAGVDDQGYFFVMKRVEGESLGDIIGRLDAGDRAAHQRWPFERRVDVIRKVLEALRYAHAKGVVHRDIKPHNIVVGPMGEVFLLDWGIARRERGAPDVVPGSAQAPGGGPLQTQAGAVMGTPMYMAPEQARGETCDARSDLYSLCVALYELLTLKHPLAHLTTHDEVMKAVVSRPTPLAPLLRHPHQQQVPMDLGWLLKKGLAKDPAQRYQSADELIRRFDDRAEGKVPIQCHVTATRRLQYETFKLVNRFPLAFALAVIGAVAAVAYRLTP